VHMPLTLLKRSTAARLVGLMNASAYRPLSAFKRQKINQIKIKIRMGK